MTPVWKAFPVTTSTIGTVAITAMNRPTSVHARERETSVWPISILAMRSRSGSMA